MQEQEDSSAYRPEGVTLSVVFLIDCSGSMSQEFLPLEPCGDTKLDVAIKAVEELMRRILKPGDKYIVARFNERCSKIGVDPADNEFTTMSSVEEDVRQVKATLASRVQGKGIGGSNLSNAVKWASDRFTSDQTEGNRVIVLSDLDLNSGEAKLRLRPGERPPQQDELLTWEQQPVRDGIPWLERP